MSDGSKDRGATCDVTCVPGKVQTLFVFPPKDGIVPTVVAQQTPVTCWAAALSSLFLSTTNYREGNREAIEKDPESEGSKPENKDTFAGFEHRHGGTVENVFSEENIIRRFKVADLAPPEKRPYQYTGPFLVGDSLGLLGSNGPVDKQPPLYAFSYYLDLMEFQYLPASKLFGQLHAWITAKKVPYLIFNPPPSAIPNWRRPPTWNGHPATYADLRLMSADERRALPDGGYSYHALVIWGIEWECDASNGLKYLKLYAMDPDPRKKPQWGMFKYATVKNTKSTEVGIKDDANLLIPAAYKMQFHWLREDWIYFAAARPYGQPWDKGFLDYDPTTDELEMIHFHPMDQLLQELQGWDADELKRSREWYVQNPKNRHKLCFGPRLKWAMDAVIHRGEGQAQRSIVEEAEKSQPPLPLDQRNLLRALLGLPEETPDASL